MIPIPPDLCVRLDKLNRTFLEGGRRHAVLQDLSADIRHGESLALRGRSGSGKSTLLNLISGIDTPDAGRIFVNGRDLTGMTEHDRTLFRRRHIGFVYQSFNLIPTLSVADNVGLVLELNGVRDKDAMARIGAELEAVGLADRATSFPEQLSGGEQQRVAIARALVHRPRLVLADEPTGNLDEENAATVLALLRNLREQHGCTLIMATHSDSIAATCDRVVELRNGRFGSR